MKKLSLILLSLCICSSAFATTSVSMKLSGEGAVNDSTVTAGKKVSVDFYLENEGTFKGVTLGFEIKSDKIRQVIHPADSGKGINKHGDVKAYNGWDDTSVWDMLNGLIISATNWDGKLPDLIGFGGVAKGKGYTPHKFEKKFSFDLLINETGTITIDSAFFAPSGRWLFAPPSTAPKWGGPYTIKVIK